MAVARTTAALFIAKVLSKIDELIEEKKALLSDWQQFKKGLLQQMFV